MTKKQNRKYFTLELSSELQNAMREMKKINGINWGFILRIAIQEQLNKVAKKEAAN